MNVSFTRARSKLVIFGSQKTLRSAPVLSEFLDLMKDKGWILKLPVGAEEMHALPVSASPRNPHKRLAEEMEKDGGSVPGLENAGLSSGPVKRSRVPKSQQGLLRGRPLLQDVVNSLG